MKELVVHTVSALDTPHVLIDKLGKEFKLICLDVGVAHPNGKREVLRLLFAPQHLDDMLPKLQGAIQMALTQSKEPGTRH